VLNRMLNERLVVDMPRRWTAVLARLGVPTGDGRILAPGGISSRDLPLPLLWQETTGDGHGGAQVVGRIESMAFDNGMVTATGSLLGEQGWQVEEMIEAGVIGPSVDLDDIEYVMDANELIVITQGRIAGATLVAIPAFADVSITLDPLPVEPMDAEIAERDAERGIEARPMTAEEGAMIGESFFSPLTASATVEVRPPLEWFSAPDLDRLTPLTISDTGRVFGHIAPWGQCHIGLPGCVTAPSSLSGYSYFTVGEQACDDGTVIPVGTLVAGPRHADAQMAFQAAQAHYDDPTAAVAKVVAGEDEFGIWVAGWMLPGASPAAVETFRSSPVSGDWRRIGGSLEMIAVCSVNAPGFPIPKARVSFSAGHQRTLIGSFGITPVAGSWEDARTSDSFVATRDTTGRAKWAWALSNEGR